MTRDELDKLLGGYATGTLSQAERTALFEAALRDQALFEALAAEDALKEVLDEPAVRARIGNALEQRPGARARFTAWLRRPAAWSAAAAVAATVVVAVVLIGVYHPPAPPVAAVRLAERVEVAAPAPVEPSPAAEPRAAYAPVPARRVKEKKQAEIPPPPDLVAVDASKLHLEAGPPAGVPPPETMRADLSRAAAVQRPQAHVDVVPPPPATQDVRLQDRREKNALRYTAAPGIGATTFVAIAPELQYRVDQNPLRVTFVATAPGHLYVIGRQGILLNSPIDPAAPRFLDPPAGESKITAVLCRAPDPGPAKGLIERARKRGDSVTEIALR